MFEFAVTLPTGFLVIKKKLIEHKILQFKIVLTIQNTLRWGVKDGPRRQCI